MASDKSFEELHAFAVKIDLKKCWFHYNKHHAHYDLTSEKVRSKAIKAGAVVVNSRQLLKLMLKSGLWTSSTKGKTK